MSRGSSPKRQQEQVNEEDEYNSLKATAKKSSGFAKHLLYVPFGLIFSALGILLYVFVGGVELQADVPYIATAYAIGAIGLTVAYSNVAQWVIKQRSQQLKKSYEGSEGVWFSLFYNNAFFVFLLLLGSHLVFSTLQPSTSMILTQLCAAAIPAWMSSLSK